jgi:hypothetical protein
MRAINLHPVKFETFRIIVKEYFPEPSFLARFFSLIGSLFSVTLCCVCFIIYARCHKIFSDDPPPAATQEEPPVIIHEIRALQH